MITATYVGKVSELKGKTAIVSKIDGPVCFVQFDQEDLIYRNVSLGLGQHMFALSDFEIVEAIES